MKTKIFNIVDTTGDTTHAPDTVFSLSPFLSFIREKAEQATGKRRTQLQQIMDGLENPATQGTEPERPDESVFELIFATLLPPSADESEVAWGVSLPFSAQVLAGTDALYSLLDTYMGSNFKMPSGQAYERKKIHKLVSVYKMILERCYGISIGTPNELVQQVKDPVSGMNKYYKVGFDGRFVHIEFKGALPEINFESVDWSNADDDAQQRGLQFLMRQLPLEQFRFEGFTIIRIEDVTAQQALENIKDIIVNLSPQKPVYNDVAKALREMIGSPGVDIMLMPSLKVNERLVTNCFEGLHSEISQACGKFNLNTSLYIEAVEEYVRHPRLIYRNDISEPSSDEMEERIFAALRENGIKGVVVIPVFFQRELVGILSLFAKGDEMLRNNILPIVAPAIPLLEQLLQTTIDDFRITLDEIVKNQFTTLQPSVQWKFNEVAFQYLMSGKTRRKPEIGQVYFENVYPMYGAIDIRNSTLERNNALRADMLHQLELLEHVLQQLSKERDMGLTNELLFKTRGWKDRVDIFISSDDEFNLNLFFEEEANPFLVHFRQAHPRAAGTIGAYFRALKPGGSAFAHREALEKSLQMLTQATGNLLDQMNIDLQEAYPYYFEKYRSDGIEYDIYIGQSITPHRPYHSLYLKNLRLWQLNSMALIARLTHALKAQLPTPLQTTQLIFVHAHAIDISFRNDEHRFDVEGAYNIRYEMIKKRIDKVMVKGNTERLTQPGKIALVYFQPKDVEEYMSHIRFLQSENILAEEVEMLELEELQGVNGLKAIRVTVIHEEDTQKLNNELAAYGESVLKPVL